MTKTTFTWALVPIAAAVLLTACGNKDAAKVEAPTAASASTAAGGNAVVVKIGHAAPLTGSDAHLGKDNENGARLAVEEINAAGLEIGGKKVKLELLGEDDAGDPKTGMNVAQKLVDAKIVAMVGHLNSGVSIPTAKIYSDAGIAQISPSSTNPEYTKQGYKTTFRVIATDAQQGPALADYAKKTLKVQTVAIVDDATAYGKGLADEFEKKAKAQGIKVVTREATNNKASDFKAILTKIKGTKPDLIMYGGMDGTAGPFTKQSKELGIAAKIMGGDGLCTDKIIELAGDAVTNVICSQAGPALSKMPKGTEFEAKFKKRFNNGNIEYNAPNAYDAVMVVVDAMKRSQSVEPAKILAEMPNTNYQGVIGNIAFDKFGDIKEGIITLYDFKDKKRNVLDVVKM